MSIFLSFILAPLLAIGPAALILLLPPLSVWLPPRIVLLLIGTAAVVFLAGRLVAHGEHLALQKVERQNHEAVSNGVAGAGRVRACSGPDSVWDVATGKCLRIGTSHRD